MKKLSILILSFLLVATFVHTPDVLAQTCSQTPSSTDTMSIDFFVPQTGNYTVWNRMITPDTTNNSYFMQIDGGCAVNVGDSSSITPNQLTWVNYQDGNTASAVTANLTAGNHTLLLTERESGVGADTLLFTDDPTCVPVGTGANCQNAVSVTPTSPQPSATPTPSACSMVDTAWQNTAMASQNGTFTFTVDATPNTSTSDAVIGLSNAAASDYPSLAAIARFNTTGTIDARNGGAYTAAVSYPYTANIKYTFRMVVNPPAHTYSVYVKPAGSATETTIGSNYTFRTEQAAVTSLSNIAFVSASGGMTVCSPVTSQPAPTTTPTITPTPTIIPTRAPTPTPVTQTYNINPMADAYVNANSSRTNYGTSTTLNIDSSPANYGYLKFDLRSLAGKTIVSANLRIATTTDPSTNQQRIKPVSDISWGETTINYSNRPAITNTTLATITSNNAKSAWQQVSLTSTAASNVGKIFSLGIDSTGSDNIGFYAKESANKPVLVIQAR